MNIVFEWVEYKNFMKAGNTPIRIELNTAPLTLIGGANGAGKTSVLSAIIFALYGKSERKINKPQLINSINQKNLLVSLSFKIGTDQYLIKRGLRPNIFQIFRNGNELDSESASKIDQDYLENQILRMNYKTFTQVCLLSSGNFVPFFGLPAGGKREIIDDILGLSIFSEMKILLKNKIDVLKEDYQNETQQVKFIKEKIEYQKRSLSEIETKLNMSLSEKQNQIAALLNESEQKNAVITEKQNEFDKARVSFEKKKSELDRALGSVNENIKSHTHSIKDVVKKMRFFDTNNECPTCFQEIKDEQKQKYKNSVKDEIQQLNRILEEEKENQARLQLEYKKSEEHRNQLSAKQEEISDLQRDLQQILQHIKFIEKEILNLNTDNNILFTHKKDLENEITNTENELETTKESTESLKNKLLHHHFISDMLKDDGIKTKVVRHYLPIINTLMEKYLDLFSFFVSFNLDENFNEVIKERHYSQFSYESFSEGEKSRLNLAILFTFRELIKIRNSAQVNLLFLDEIFQSSLDEYGKNVLMEVLQTLSADGENVFVISHDKDIKDESEFSFSRVLEFGVKNNFSFYTDVTEA
jgi:DNA repair exonuclease SbcCD ATPase subunit